MWKPDGRRDDLLEAAVADETIVYDTANHLGMTLSPLGAAVWKACNGERSLAEVAQRAAGACRRPVDEETVREALSELVKAGLVLAPPPTWGPPTTRRRFLRTAALATPVVAVLGIPPPAAAASGLRPPGGDVHTSVNDFTGGGDGGYAAAGVGGAVIPAGFLLPACREKWRHVELQPYSNRAIAETPLRDLLYRSGAEVVSTRSRYEGVPFRYGTELLALSSEADPRLPQRIAEVRIGWSFERLYLLHTALGEAGRPGERLAHYLVRYADGDVARIPVDYGQDVAAYLPGASETSYHGMRSRLVWDRHAAAVLFISVWKNPRPEEKVVSVDYVSGFGASTPTCVAMTTGECSSPIKETREARRR